MTRSSDSAPTARANAGDTTGALERLSLGFAVLAGLTCALLVLGALVRANGAGLACPDWPLCFGELVPEFNIKVAFEWGHRLVAGSITLLFTGLSFFTYRRAPANSSVRLLIITTALLLCIQILLGAFTVWKLLASWSVTSHLLTGNTIAASMLIISRELSEIAKPQSHRKHVARPLRTAILVAAGLLVLQMGLGGWVSSAYAGLACPDWPTCLGGEWFPTFSGIQGIHVFHRLNAYALLIVLVACAGLSRGLPVLGTLCALAGVLVAAQVAVGVGNVLLRIPIELTGLHSALAALLVAVLSLAVRELWYSPR